MTSRGTIPPIAVTIPPHVGDKSTASGDKTAPGGDNRGDKVSAGVPLPSLKSSGRDRTAPRPRRLGSARIVNRNPVNSSSRGFEKKLSATWSIPKPLTLLGFPLATPRGDPARPERPRLTGGTTRPFPSRVGHSKCASRGYTRLQRRDSRRAGGRPRPIPRRAQTPTISQQTTTSRLSESHASERAGRSPAPHRRPSTSSSNREASGYERMGFRDVVL